MKVLTIPNEVKRLEVLESFAILDTPPEQKYDDITRLASIICAMPMAFITLMDKKRQWFKSKVGIGVSETPRALSFCQYTMLGTEIYEVENLAEHERFHRHIMVDNPPHLRFYAGAPLITSDGYCLGTLCVMDVKERKLSQTQYEALQILSHEVVAQLELHRQNIRLQQTETALMQANAILKSFAYSASHDLKQPLRTIMSFAQLMERRYKTDLDEEGKTYLNYIIGGVQNMQALIKGLLEYAELSNNLQPKMETIVINDLFINVLHNLNHQITSNHAVITFDENLPEQLTGIPFMLVQLFQNLISNAIKFQKKDTAPNIHIGIKEQEQHWLFSIKDNGIGIEDEFLAFVFKLFKRLHTVDKYTGSGIGLSICKKIIEIHHGEIWVESKVGEGSTFYFTLGK